MSKQQILQGFQSTLPREERLIRQQQSSHLQNFNPRSHERSDVYVPVNRTRRAISIHAPTRGATKSPEVIPPLSLFQSTLPREERRKRTIHDDSYSYFNPRSHERSDVVEEATKDLALSFQSTLPREERRLLAFRSSYLCLISIHAPTRGATGSNSAYAPRLIYFNPRSHERSDIVR